MLSSAVVHFFALHSGQNHYKLYPGKRRNINKVILIALRKLILDIREEVTEVIYKNAPTIVTIRVSSLSSTRWREYCRATALDFFFSSFIYTSSRQLHNERYYCDVYLLLLLETQ